ncbi:phage Gp37/Gp68 family protein [Stenotrophomonas acidaminiphila]|uniref:phage Gp37/Gp68 family protein n=1 Tax=Stenotrophomonas acidaminiphila TaxID=128780 RepID=UPI0028A84F81|nr:phage Gp37/Gp68 family protein [Stenotrophomonas acidaminiphila]
MADQTHIEWCDSTFNPWIGCTKVSPACDHCYAAVSTPARTCNIAWGAGQPRRRTSPANWKLPLRWNARPFLECPACHWRGEAKGAHWGGTGCPRCSGQPQPARRRVFCASLADVFDNEVDPQWRAALFALIQATPNLDWLLLTKRIGNAHQMIGESLIRIAGGTDLLPSWPWPNVWLGATIATQAEADRDIPKLLAVPAAVRFLSMEPLLGSVDMSGALLEAVPRSEWIGDPPATLQRREAPGTPLRRRLPGIDWVIVGGESGPNARPMHPDWARSLRDQCAAARVPFLFKQWGEWAPFERPRGFDWKHPGGDFATWDGEKFRPFYPNLHELVSMRRIGKKAAGRMLDGQEHSEFPA